MRRGRWHGSSAFVLLVCLVLGGCASQRPAEPIATPGHGGHGLAGVRWRLRQVTGPAGTVAIPASLDSYLEVTSQYAISGKDGCSFFTAAGYRSAQGFTASDVASTANGCLSDHGARDAARSGFSSILSGQPARVRLSGGQLRLTTGKYTLVFATAGPLKL
jgi:heat shock protein HslJ